MRRKMASAEALNDRKLSPLSPTRTAATPIATAMTMICRMLNDSPVFSAPPSPALVEAERPRILDGISPRRKSSHEPAVSGRTALPAATPAWRPGCNTVPSVRPMVTAISAVIANQMKVAATSRAALFRSRSAAIDATMAVNTSGTTSTLSNWTKLSPMMRRPSANPASPCDRASRPSSRPTAMPTNTCAPKEKRNLIRP